MERSAQPIVTMHRPGAHQYRMRSCVSSRTAWNTNYSLRQWAQQATDNFYSVRFTIKKAFYLDE